MKHIIELCNISKQYGSSVNKINALKKITTSIDEGEMIAIIGSSGSGKSTLLNIIGLLDTPTKGEYLLNGEDVSHFGNKMRAQLRNSTFGFVVQDFALVDKYTVKQNIELPITYAKTKIDCKKSNLP